jgi:hypothetical protein
MIKIFQKTRYALIKKNSLTGRTGNTRKYLKYAFGEILLVVLGILIALQISNWNQNRKKYNKETSILVTIHKEFKDNKTQLERVVKTHQIALLNCAKIIDLFPIKTKPKPQILDSLSIYLWESYGGYTFDPSQTSINALSSTSSFDIISNITLRDLLISWNDLIKDYQEEERTSKEFTINQYNGYLSKHFDFRFNFKDPRNNMKALQSLEFEFLIKNKYDLTDQILHSSGELKTLRENLNKIIELSDAKN